MTSLMYAASKGHMKATNFLVSAGADANRQEQVVLGRADFPHLVVVSPLWLCE